MLKRSLGDEGKRVGEQVGCRQLKQQRWQKRLEYRIDVGAVDASVRRQSMLLAGGAAGQRLQRIAHRPASGPAVTVPSRVPDGVGV